MRRRRIFSVLMAVGLVALGGCGRLRSAADGVRDSAEQKARTARVESQRSALRIMQQSVPVAETNALLLGDRYILRAEGGGWSVIDLENNAPISVSGKKVQGVDQASARQALDNLEADRRLRGVH